MKMVKLNLGCGNDIRESWKNFDKYPIGDVKYLDLTNLPLPFPDDYADEIVLKHVFEHLDGNQYSFMNEISRILKKGGSLEISVPIMYQCVEHENIFFTWDYFNNLKSELYGSLFKDITVKYTYNNLGDIIWKLKQFLFWVAGREITYKFKK